MQLLPLQMYIHVWGDQGANHRRCDIPTELVWSPRIPTSFRSIFERSTRICTLIEFLGRLYFISRF